MSKEKEVPPEKIIPYPIPGDETGGRLFLYGKSDARNVVLFCAGYPDDQGSFSKFAARLATESSGCCLCGVACLVGYDDYKPYKTYYRPEGYTFDEMATSLRAAAKALRQYSSNDKAKYTTIFHDWGSAIGAIYTNRALEEQDPLLAPDKIVYFDVLPLKAHPQEPNPPEPEPKGKFAFALEQVYRLQFAIMFFLQWRLSKYVALLFFLCTMPLLQITGLSPGGKRDKEVFETRNMDIYRLMYMAYPYYFTLCQGMKGKVDEIIADFHLPLLERVPVLYMYGVDKNAHFHDQNLADFLKEQNAKGKKSNCIAVQDAAHWLYIQQEDECMDAVKKFVLE